MKALVLTRYGSPFNLELRERATPSPQAGEVLVKVRATTVNDIDWCFVRGKPLVYRLIFGLFKPNVAVLGTELSGTVEALGSGAQKFKVGDAVYGDVCEAGFGGFAEYACVRENALVRKPLAMSFEEAAAVPHAGILALQGLVSVGKIRRGETVLINGAGGGVGTIGVQIAKQYAAEVTGVDSTAKLPMMRSIGFDHIIDYTREDFTRAGQKYDLILDTKTNRSPFSYLRALKAGGRYVTVGGEPRFLIAALGLGWIVSKLTGKDIRIVALKPNQGLEEINRLYEAEGLQSVIDGPYPLTELPRALQRFGEAKHIGKIVIRVNSGAA